MKSLYVYIVRLCKSAATYRYLAKICGPLCVAAFLATGTMVYKAMEAATDAAYESMTHHAIAAGIVGVVFLVAGVLAENGGEDR